MTELWGPSYPAEPGPRTWAVLDPAGTDDWPLLEASAVHVWRLQLDQPAARHLTAFDHELDAAEHERAGRLRCSRDRLRFVAAHVFLRRVIARYVNREPQRLHFQVGAHGKPALLDGDGSAARGARLSEVCFSLSHSDHIAVLGVAQGVQIGVDVEIHRPLADADRIAESNFAASECARLRELPPAERLPAFFDLWTRKEAFVKALGVGLSMPLDRFEVAFGPGQPPAVLRVDGNAEAGRRWTLFDGDLGAGTSSAIAVPSANTLEVRFFSCA